MDQRVTPLNSNESGDPQRVPAYRIDLKRNALSLARAIATAEWAEIFDVLRERRIKAFAANGCMTDDVLEGIAGLPDLTSLHLGGCRALTDDGLLHLSRMPQLMELDLSEYPGGQLTDRSMHVLQQLPNLRRFEMAWQCGVSDEGLSNLRFCQQIESINLMGTQTGDGVIGALRGKPKLRRFHSGRLVTDAGLTFLRDFPAFQTWTDLEEETSLLIDGPFTDNGLKELAGLHGLSALDLFWHVTEVTSDGFAVLKELPHLKSLGCDGELSDDEAMVHIAAIPGLRKLRAQSSVATDEGFLALSRSQSLENLWGRECPNFASAGFVALSRMPALRALGISCKQVSGGALSVLSNFPALRDFTAIGVTDECFRHVSTCERLERLSCMYCRDTTDVATEHIANLRLHSYYAGLTQITDRSLEILGHMSTLESIELYQTKLVTDKGIAHLAPLPHLSEVHLNGLPNVTYAGSDVFPPRVQVNYRA